MAALIREARGNYFKLKIVKVGKIWVLLDHTMQVFSNFVKEKKIFRFEEDMHFNQVTLESLNIQVWLGVNPRKP